MASYTLTVEKVRRINGKVYILFSDGIEIEIAGLNEAKAYVGDLNKEILRKLALSRYLQVDPNGTNPALIEGRSITFTNESNTMVSVS